jgi:hypothetical protein
MDEDLTKTCQRKMCWSYTFQTSNVGAPLGINIGKHNMVHMHACMPCMRHALVRLQTSTCARQLGKACPQQCLQTHNQNRSGRVALANVVDITSPQLAAIIHSMLSLQMAASSAVALLSTGRYGLLRMVCIMLVSARC